MGIEVEAWDPFASSIIVAVVTIVIANLTSMLNINSSLKHYFKTSSTNFNFKDRQQQILLEIKKEKFPLVNFLVNYFRDLSVNAIFFLTFYIINTHPLELKSLKMQHFLNTTL